MSLFFAVLVQRLLSDSGIEPRIGVRALPTEPALAESQQPDFRTGHDGAEMSMIISEVLLDL